MTYKNSMKLLTSNFSFVWKQLAYNIVRLAIIIGLVVAVSNPIVKVLVQNNLPEKFANAWQLIYTNFGEFLHELKQTIVLFTQTISENMASIWYSICLFFFVVLFVNNFLKNFGKYAMTDVAQNCFTSLNKKGFCQSLISNFGAASKYALAKFLLDLPFDFLKMLFISIYCMALDSVVLAIFGLSALAIMYTITFALQISFYNSIAIEMIGGRKNPFAAILRGYKSTKDFFKNYSNAIVIVLTIILVNVIVGVFTFGAGLLITLPASNILVIIFELISYYGGVGQRYYLSTTIIVDPNAEKINKINLKD